MNDNEILDGLKGAIIAGMKDGLKSKFTQYNSSLDKWLTETLNESDTDFKSLFNEAVKSCMSDQSFRGEIIQAYRANLAAALIKRFGQKLDLDLNALKTDPVSRAKITEMLESLT